MIRTAATLLLLCGGMTQPAWADQAIDWRGLLQGQGNGIDGPHRGPMAPMVAPPVVVDRHPGLHHGRDLPSRCLQSVETPDGWHRLYDSACLSNRLGAEARLPRICRVQLVTWGGIRDGYDPQCLDDTGFRPRR
ncbi:hypothetical protein ACOI1H_11830 [Loktanella sp. DJP18]|uniref:hypothetical protein n=1 Tax=Loktanella sp. DJP18 TaxID=3409788 RepID=UPI003BB5D07E